MKKIVIIDDEKDFCDFVKENLELTGDYKVRYVTNPKKGVSAVSQHKPDLILLDIMMSPVSGFDILKELKENKNTSSIPVVMLTAVDNEESKQKAFGLRDEDYLVKPISMADLKAKIEEVLSRK